MSQKFRFHVLGIPHTISNKDYVACAFTQKAVKFCEMMKSRGHTIIHYGHEKSDVVCDEMVSVTNDKALFEAYGEYNWHKNFFKFDLEDAAYKEFYKNAIREIGLRKQKNDFLLCFWGWGHKAIADAHPDMLIVEPGIGYPSGHHAKYKVFESQSTYNAYYGLNSVARSNILNWYDVVIPNYFDLREFEYREEKDDYYLCLGRIGEHKGVHIAIQATEKIGAKLKIAGQGSLAEMGYADIPAHVEYVGHADLEQRKKLMGGARALFAATTYNEPFGGVHVEAMLSGTPVITTDWGAFAECNIHGLTGYRCRTFEHFTWAAENIWRINPRNCREWAVANFSMEKVAKMFEEYFYSIIKVYDGSNGWYEPNPARTELDWLERRYPSHPNRAEPPKNWNISDKLVVDSE
jgi:glycosyltransferase involved in cell wall biosynthesis